MSTKHTTFLSISLRLSITSITESKQTPELLWKWIYSTARGAQTNPSSSVVFCDINVCGSFALKGVGQCAKAISVASCFFPDLSLSLLINSLGNVFQVLIFSTASCFRSDFNSKNLPFRACICHFWWKSSVIYLSNHSCWLPGLAICFQNDWLLSLVISLFLCLVTICWLH